jgi:hypothetical protein
MASVLSLRQVTSLKKTTLVNNGGRFVIQQGEKLQKWTLM